MKKELDEKLCADFPKLYQQRNMPMSQTCMCWGFPGDGWFDIIYRLSKALTDLDEDIVAVQVKEKFGELRFYIDGGSDKAYDLIDDATEESGRVCEVCGEPGMKRDGGWIKTLCDKHAK